ncbi:hypothetical protein H8S90_21900 [Olivibacter sp. SDN3]|uniref:hypothetical protein n=1 Tax=Olivibacter sp. SDN3 TaxID=2764720 RepID=UPI0016511856|nr:hypothetical protein [Olivibacter sp. SDN3]QNL49354.1 hypothetical protein H8S90_21900 [Olivibacter sp. SDN3]
MKSTYLLILTLCLVLGACEKDEMLLEREVSPVLILFNNEPAPEGEISVRASFYELDKTNILDQELGIDSIPLTGLPIRVYINTSTPLGEFTTDTQGQILFNADRSTLEGANRLEWTGEHKGVAFRQLQTIE